MGAYVNPPSITKEEWLAEYGKPIDKPPKRFDEHPGKLPVCLVDNGPFTAAGIAFCQRELDAFTLDRDTRPKKWFLVDESKLHEVSPNLKDYQEHA